MMRVLGIDASTTTIGIAVLDDENLSHTEFFKPDKKVSQLLMLAGVKTYMKELYWKWLPDVVVIEDIVQYMPGKSSAKTIIGLAVLNRTVGLTWLELMGVEPSMLGVLKVRHALKLGKVLPKKEDIPELVAGVLGLPSFPWLLRVKRGSKTPVRAAESYDVADAVAVALAWTKIDRMTGLVKSTSEQIGLSE